jgi:hypothetical protein
VWIIVAVVGVVAVLLALYASWTARRLDRLHARVDAAAAALQAQLIRRAKAVEDFAASLALPAADSGPVVLAARQAVQTRGLGPDREVVENVVTRSLAELVSRLPDAAPSTPQTTAMHDQALRATFGRRFYNDTVRDALVVRDRRIVRWLRLAGRAPHPAYFEIVDDDLPLTRISVASAPTMER